MTIRSVSTVLIVALCILAGQRAVSTQAAPGPYFVADLGTLGGTESRALGLSARGLETVGSASRSDASVHAFVFGKTMTDLGTLGGASSAATDINRTGTVVGRAQVAGGSNRAFAYSATTGMQSLGTLGGSQSQAFAINDVGDVVGSSDTAGNAATRAFIYRNGTMSLLAGTFGGTKSAATALNDGQEVVGWASTAGNATVHAFLYSGGTMTDLGTLGTSSEATAVNDAAEVAGRSTLASGVRHAFLYTGGSMLDLGTLGGPNSEATGLNTYFTQVVGTSDIPGGGTHAFLYERGTMTDLNSRLPAGSGWVLEAATAINDSGEIVGWGRINGQRHAFRLTPPVKLAVRSGGVLTQEDSNLPRGGVQVGRNVTFVTSVQVISDGTARNVVFTDTMSGAIDIVGVRLYHEAGTCTVAAKIVNCQFPTIGVAASFEEEVWVTVRVTAPGAFSHTAHATAYNNTPDSSVDTAREDNIGIALAAFTLSLSTVAGGTTVSAKGTLTSLAPSGGAVVKIVSSNPSVAPVPSQLIVQLPTATRSFNIVPAVVSQPTSVTISATYGLVTISQTLTVLPPALKSLALTRSTMIGSCQTASAKVTLTGWAPSGGAVVSLAATAAGVNSPTRITVPAGTSSLSFTVNSRAVSTINSGTFTASYGGTSKSLSLAVRPIYVQSLVLTPSSVVGGNSVSGVATTECAAPSGGMTVALSSTNTSIAAPTTSSVVVAAGATKGTFTVRTTKPAATTTVTIKASAHAVTKNASLTVTR
jgi:probable HAF family extracellular repeat protein